jgi:hypothetical protein
MVFVVFFALLICFRFVFSFRVVARVVYAGPIMKNDTGAFSDLMRFVIKDSTGEIGGVAFRSLAQSWSPRMKV